tara:strand:+ start:946 stop:1296 length:351 start_codon:yes stop_codon:yes gene_type:complete
MKPLHVLKQAADLIAKKGNDYQNPKSRIRQADYYPNGAQTILDIMTGKINRMHSVLDAMRDDENYLENFESLQDSAIDLINYSAFFSAYLDHDIDGQTPENDIFNRKIINDDTQGS